MRTSVAASAMTAFLLAATVHAQPAAPAPAAPTGSRPAILSDIGFDQRLGEPLPLDISLRDESGKAVRLADYFGKRPVLLSLVYFECPMLCTLTLNGLVSAMDTLSFDAGREFEVITVSFDHRETPALAAAKKAAYLKRYRRKGAAEGWHFLTGDEEQVRRLTAAVGFRFAWDEATKQFAHPAGTVVLTPEGKISRYLYGVEYSPRDIRFAVVESSAGRIGTALDRVVLSCYQYDPMRGKYGLLTLRLVRAGGVLTVLALGTFIVTMRRRETRALAEGAR